MNTHQTFSAIKDYSQRKVIGTYDIPTTLLLCDLRQHNKPDEVKQAAERYKQQQTHIAECLPLEIQEFEFPFTDYKDKVYTIASFHVHVELGREMLLEEAQRDNCDPSDLQYYYAVVNSGWSSKRKDCAPSKARAERNVSRLKSIILQGVVLAVPPCSSSAVTEIR